MVQFQLRTQVTQTLTCKLQDDGWRSRSHNCSVILNHPKIVNRCLTQPNQTPRSVTIVKVLIPFMSKKPWLDDPFVSWSQLSNASVSPKSELRKLVWNLQCIISPCINRE